MFHEISEKKNVKIEEKTVKDCEKISENAFNKINIDN